MRTFALISLILIDVLRVVVVDRKPIMVGEG